MSEELDRHKIYVDELVESI